MSESLLILIVDDNASVSRALSRQLRYLFDGHVGVLAAERAETLMPELPNAALLITDADLGPGQVHGPGLIAVVHSIRPDLPCLLYSGNPSMIQKITPDAVTATMLKPYDMDELRAVVVALVPALSSIHPAKKH